MWQKFINFINIPAHIKKLYLNWKIKKFKQDNTKSNLLKILNAIIIALLLGGLGYLVYIYRYNLRRFYFEHTLEVLIGGGIIIVLVLMIFVKKLMDTNQKIDYSQISKIILKDQDNKNIKSWNITDKTALLIGKKTDTNQVDIDLSETTYSKLISREHGVINNTGDNWYFEDIGSANGSGIKRRGQSEKRRIEEGNPCLLNCGDTIYIANTKLKLPIVEVS